MCCWCLLLCCSCWMCRPWYVLLNDWILNVNWPKVKYNCSWGVCIECHTTCLRINIPVVWISGVRWEDRSYKSRFLLFHLYIGVTITCLDNYVLFRNSNVVCITTWYSVVETIWWVLHNMYKIILWFLISPSGISSLVTGTVCVIYTYFSFIYLLHYISVV